MNKCISIAEAKTKFSDCIRSLEGGASPMLITRHGKIVAALVRPDNKSRHPAPGAENKEWGHLTPLNN